MILCNRICQVPPLFSVKDGGWGFKLEAGAGSVVE